jgi:hypothetical protein
MLTWKAPTAAQIETWKSGKQATAIRAYHKHASFDLDGLIPSALRLPTLTAPSTAASAGRSSTSIAKTWGSLLMVSSAFQTGSNTGPLTSRATQP